MARGPRIADGTPRRPMSRPLAVRVPARVLAAMEVRAAAAGVTAASVARRTLAEAFTGDPADEQPVRRYRPTNPRPSTDVVALAGLREVVGEAVGTLRQVAGLDRARGGTRLPELDAAIDSLLTAAADLDAWKEAVRAHDRAQATR